jgi:hypothetical protein
VTELGDVKIRLRIPDYAFLTDIVKSLRAECKDVNAGRNNGVDAARKCRVYRIPPLSATALTKQAQISMH